MTTMPTRLLTILNEIIPALFILLFIYAAMSKLLDYQKFQVQLSQSPLLTSFATWVAWIIPALEIAISLMLAFPKTRLSGLYGSFSLMVMFSGYIIAITNFSEFVPCSCGGVLQRMSWNQHLIFNIFFVVAGLTGIILYKSKTEKKAATSIL